MKYLTLKNFLSGTSLIAIISLTSPVMATPNLSFEEIVDNGRKMLTNHAEDMSTFLTNVAAMAKQEKEALTQVQKSFEDTKIDLNKANETIESLKHENAQNELKHEEQMRKQTSLYDQAIGEKEALIATRDKEKEELEKENQTKTHLYEGILAEQAKSLNVRNDLKEKLAGKDKELEVSATALKQAKDEIRDLRNISYSNQEEKKNAKKYIDLMLAFNAANITYNFTDRSMIANYDISGQTDKVASFLTKFKKIRDSNE
jgi:hypothetical protein